MRNSVSPGNLRLQKIISDIHEVGLLPNDWKGPGSVSPANQTVHDAQVFAKLLFADPAILAPVISAASDGEINFYWKTANVRIDLGFFGDSTYSFYAELVDGSEVLKEGVSIDTPLPDTLLSLIRL